MEGATLRIHYVLDADNGVTDAIVACSCGQYALLNLLDWTGPGLARRVFSVSLLQDKPVRIMLRNLRSDYCDLSRKHAEIAALCATADRVGVVLAADVPELRVRAVERACVRRPLWREDLATPGETGWPARLGIAAVQQA